MFLSTKLKNEIKEQLVKLIRAKKTGIVAMKEKAYAYAESKLPKWFVILFGGYIRNKIDTLFMEALANVKCD